MQLPLETVLRRGVVFLWPDYARLDDPALKGQTKPKFIVILSGSPLDDPLVYILTTSEKSKHERHPFPQDLFLIPADRYGFFPANTVIDAGESGQLDVGRAEFATLYEGGAVVYKGVLTDDDVAALVKVILASARVSRRFKQILTGRATPPFQSIPCE